MTTADIEAWLAKHHPDKHWVTFDNLFGLPMLDGVMLYCQADEAHMPQLAQQIIAMAEGVKLK